MPAFRFFFPFLSGILMAGVFPASAREPVERLTLCEFGFSAPPGTRVVERRNDMFLLEQNVSDRSMNDRGFHWIIVCTPNVRRTNRIEELAEEARTQGGAIRGLRVVLIDSGVRAAFFEKERIQKGRKIHSLNAYFATRDFEYNFAIIGREGGAVIDGPLSAEKSRELEKTVMEGRFISAVVPAISEREYQRRFAVFIAVLFFLAVAIILISVGWFFRRRKRKRASAK